MQARNLPWFSPWVKFDRKKKKKRKTYNKKKDKEILAGKQSLIESECQLFANFLIAEQDAKLSVRKPPHFWQKK